jgi:hypothetical protein
MVVAIATVALMLTGCAAHGIRLTLRLRDEQNAPSNALAARTEAVAVDVAEALEMTPDSRLDWRQEYSRENESYPFEVTHSFHYLTSARDASVRVHLLLGREKETGDFVASIFHGAPFVETEFSSRLRAKLATELSQAHPTAEIEFVRTRAWHVLGP